VRPPSPYLRLGRVSNLPTVWSNTLAGVWLASGSPRHVVPLALAMSAFYVGGMYLNDWFDRGVDARERPERPIPAGVVPAARVLAIGAGLLVAGVVGTAAVSSAAILPAVGLAGAIVLYDAWHKGNPLSPLLMGLCRVLVYVTCALAASGGARAVLPGAACLLAYLVGLTYTAKHENRPLLARSWPLLGLAAPLAHTLPGLAASWLTQLAFAALLVWIFRCLAVLRSDAAGRIPRTVTGLIAGIALVDALLLARAGAPLGLVGLAALAFPLTLLGQRHVPGT
jgi:4-hydroxybenzoate polyprenyltransferase